MCSLHVVLHMPLNFSSAFHPLEVSLFLQSNNPKNIGIKVGKNNNDDSSTFSCILLRSFTHPLDLS